MTSSLEILLVDSDKQSLNEFAAWLRSYLGHKVSETKNKTEAIVAFGERQFSFGLAIIADELPTREDSLALLRELRSQRDDMAVIILHKMEERSYLHEALMTGAYWYLQKPIDRIEAEVLIGSVVRWQVTKARHAHQERLMRALVNSGKAIIAANTEKRVYEIIQETLLTAFEVSRFYLAWYDANRNTISFPVVYEGTNPLNVPDRPNTVLEGGLAGHIIRTGREFEHHDPDFAENLPVISVPVYKNKLKRVYFGLPLILHDNSVVGVLSISQYQPYELTEEIRQALRTLSTQAALKLHRLKELHASDARIQLERNIVRLVKEKTNTQEFESKLIEALQNLWHDQIPKPFILLFRTNHYNRWLTLDDSLKTRYSFTHKPSEQHWRVRFGDGVCGRAAEIGESLIISDIHKDGRNLGWFEGTNSELTVPIKLGNSILGVIDIEASPKNFFTNEDRELIERVADQVAIAMAASGDEEHANKVLEVAMEAARNPENAFEILTNGAHMIASLQGGAPTSTSIYLLTEDRLELAFACRTDSYAAFEVNTNSSNMKSNYEIQFKPRRLSRKSTLLLDPPPGEKRGIIAKAVKQKRSLLVSDVKADPDYLPYDSRTNAELVVPVIDSNQNVIGALNFEFENPDALTPDKQKLLEALASQTAIMAAVEKQLTDLEEAQQTNQISTALALMGIASVDYGHSWKNAAAGAARTIELMDEHITTALANSGKGFDLTKMRRWVSRVSEIIKDDHKVIEIPNPLEDIKEQSIENLIAQLATEWKERELDIQFVVETMATSPTTIRANGFWLRRGINNLIANAARASRLNESPQVVLRTHRIENCVQIAIHDNGKGIPKSMEAHLFRRIIPKETGRKGLGAGCLITNFIARTYQGRVYIHKSAPSGTIVSMELPLSNASKKLNFS